MRSSAAGLALALLEGVARAQDAGAEAGEFAAGAPAASERAENEPSPAVSTSFEGLDAEDEPASHKKQPKKKHRFELKGRIIARAQLSSRRLELVGSDLRVAETQVKSLDLSLPSARVGLHYHSPLPGVGAVVSVELMDKPKLKNGFVQAKTADARLGVRVGQMKLPGSPFETESRLSLPSAGRGFVHDILTDRLEIGGRRPGVAVFGKLPLRRTRALELTLGAFQGSYLRDEATRDRSLLAMQALGAQTVVGRLEAALHVLKLGVTGNYRVGTNQLLQPNEELDHFWSAGVDAAVDTWIGPGGLRFWADFNLGESWFVTEHRSAGSGPLYGAARAMLAFRGGGADRGQLYVEPFAMAGVLDPDAKVARDWAFEAAAGVGVGFWERGHLTLQGALTRTQRYFPVSFVLPDYQNQKTLLLQLGVLL